MCAFWAVCASAFTNGCWTNATGQGGVSMEPIPYPFSGDVWRFYNVLSACLITFVGTYQYSDYSDYSSENVEALVFVPKTWTVRPMLTLLSCWPKDVRWTHAILLYHWLANTEPLMSSRQLYQRKSEELFQGIRRVKKYSSSEEFRMPLYIHVHIYIDDTRVGIYTYMYV